MTAYNYIRLLALRDRLAFLFFPKKPLTFRPPPPPQTSGERGSRGRLYYTRSYYSGELSAAAALVARINTRCRSGVIRLLINEGEWRPTKKEKKKKKKREKQRQKHNKNNESTFPRRKAHS